MAKDKYSAIWVSHSSISDFQECPRAYYLKNVYKSPKTGNKIRLASPPLTLGSIIHEILESLSILPAPERFRTPLLEKLDASWGKVSGKRGGFLDKETEAEYRRRGEDMLIRVTKNPGPLLKLAVKIKMDLPYYWISEDDNIILCGKIDWLEYLEEEDKVHIIDFKTSKHESTDPLQLEIYHLIASNCQERKVQGASFWYIDKSDKPTTVKLPILDDSYTKIMKIAKKIKLARQLGSFNCPSNGCHSCLPMEAVLNGDAEFVYTDSMGRDTYILPQKDDDSQRPRSEIL